MNDALDETAERSMTRLRSHILGPRGKRLLISAISCLAVLAQISSAYQNPLRAIANDRGYAADPCVIKHLGKYYLFHTDNYHVFVSDDLSHWSDAGRWADTDIIGYPLWAPSILRYNGVFYAFWSKPKEGHTILRADSPRGPFSVVSTSAHGGIDGDVFLDDDGQLYFATAGGNGIHCMRMNSPTEFARRGEHLVNCVVDAGKGKAWTEGPQIFKVDSTYYATYCGNNWRAPSYQVHVAKGDSIAHLVPQARNPLLKMTTGEWTGTGHSYIIIGPDLSTYYIVYHAKRTGSKDDSRLLMLDRISIDSRTGDISTDGPSFGEQPDPALPDWCDRFESPNLAATWLAQGGANWSFVAPGTIRAAGRGSSNQSSLMQTKAPSGSFVAEFNLRLVAQGMNGTSRKYGAVVCQSAEQDGFFVLIDPEQNRLACNVRIGGAEKGWQYSSNLPAQWDHRAWHTLRVMKAGDKFRVFIDNMLRLERRSDLGAGRIGLLVEDCQAEFGFTAFSNTSTGKGD